MVQQPNWAARLFFANRTPQNEIRFPFQTTKKGYAQNKTHPGAVLVLVGFTPPM